MIGAPFYADSVVRLRPARRVDRYGDNVADWEQEPQRTDIDNVSLGEVAASYDPESGRVLAEAGHQLVAGRHLDLATDDRIEADGEVWLLDGPPRHLRNPFSGAEKTEVSLIRLEG